MSDDRPPAPPGWYPDPKMAGTQRYWDGKAWSDHVAPKAPAPVRVESTSVLKVARGVALGILVVIGLLWFVQNASKPSDMDCAMQQADVALGNRDAVSQDCADKGYPK